jgi:hypothetical protein
MTPLRSIGKIPLKLDTSLAKVPPFTQEQGTLIPEETETSPPPDDKKLPFKAQDLLKYAPLLTGLTGLGAPKLDNYNATTTSAGLISPELIDEQTMRARIDEGYGASKGAMAGLTGGSAAAQRTGMAGIDKGYMDSIGSGFIQANQANNAAKMGVNQFNMQNQTGIAGQNMQALNQAGLYNNSQQNQYKKDKYDTRINALQDTLESAGNIGLENERRRLYGDYLGQKGYDLKSNTFAKKGGKLKYAKRLGKI